MSNGKKIALLGFTVVVLIGLFIGGARLYKSSEGQRVETIARENEEVLVRPYSPQLGNSAAKVTVVEFLDPECESCRAVSPHVKYLYKKYEGQVRLVIRYAPFHRNSEFAIRILEAARYQDKYWSALDVLFETQPEWGDHHNPQPEKIFDYLPRAFVDVQRIRDEMQDPAIAKALSQDVEDGKTLGVRGTPTFFVNGKQVGMNGLEDAIQREIAAAD
jgi:protein-disulfide isomerase